MSDWIGLLGQLYRKSYRGRVPHILRWQVVFSVAPHAHKAVAVLRSQVTVESQRITVWALDERAPPQAGTVTHQ